MLEPRLEEDEIKYFRRIMATKKDGAKMVEWGSGGSTVMFLPYFTTGSLISIEHNSEWFDKVNADISGGTFDDSALNNFNYVLRPPVYNGYYVDLKFHGYGVPHEENPCFVGSYICPDIRDLNIFDADIYFVDGIARGAVLAMIAAKATNKDAMVFVHDYYGPERRHDWYRWAENFYSGVEKVGTTLARFWL